MNPSLPEQTDPSRDRPHEGRGARAFRPSLWTWLVLALLAGAMVWRVNRPPARRQTQEMPPSASEAPASVLAEIPEARFADITTASGVRFVQDNGAYGEKLLPETMGGGVAFFDFDNDGAPDLLFVNSTYWPWHVPEGKPPPTAVLYHNDGKGHFTDVTAGSGLDIRSEERRVGKE